MITLITGTPGAGKTLYAISKLLLPLIGTTVKAVGDDGGQIEHPRTIYTNVNGLLVEHELVCNGDTWAFVGKEWKQDGENKLGLHNWHEWAKPGSVICVDEFQKLWPPRPNGAAVPPDVQSLDTHRHMGVDFILISQHVNNFDRHVQGLVGRHLHVRRIANMRLTIVYEWDHCSRSLMYSKSMAKSPWKFDKKVFKLYRSAEVHTKQPRRIPPIAFVILGALALTAWKVPETYARITRHLDKPIASAMTQAQAGQGRASEAPHAPQPAPGASASERQSVLAEKVKPRLLGCIAFKERCECYGEDGLLQETDAQTCQDGSRHVSALPLMVSRASVPSSPPKPSENDCDLVNAQGRNEVRCGPKHPVPAIVPATSSAPSQGINQGGMAIGEGGGVGAVRPDSQQERPPARNAPARAIR